VPFRLLGAGLGKQMRKPLVVYISDDPDCSERELVYDLRYVTGYVLRFTFTFYVLRFTFYVLRFTFYGFTFYGYVLRFAVYVLRLRFTLRVYGLRNVYVLRVYLRFLYWKFDTVRSLYFNALFSSFFTWYHSYQRLLIYFIAL
jgi:hypothetical protein